jgi:hypothetical protein
MLKGVGGGALNGSDCAGAEALGGVLGLSGDMLKGAACARAGCVAKDPKVIRKENRSTRMAGSYLTVGDGGIEEPNRCNPKR